MPVTRHNPDVGHGDDADVVVTPAVANHNLGVGQRDGEAVANHDFGVVHHDGEGAVVTPVWQSTTLVSGTTTPRAPSLPLDVSKKQKKYIN